jgi:hypothetical protein
VSIVRCKRSVMALGVIVVRLLRVDSGADAAVKETYAEHVFYNRKSRRILVMRCIPRSFHIR